VPPRTLTVAVFNESTGWTLPEPLLERLRHEAGDRVVVTGVASRRELMDLLPETDYLVGFPLTEGQFRASDAERLQWVQLTGSSGESLSPLRSTIGAGVRVTGSARIRAVPCAEHALALTLALCRRLHDAIRGQIEHDWAASRIAPAICDLDGRTVGLLGMSPIGEEIALRAKAFGCEVVALAEEADNPYLHVDRVLGPRRKEQFLKRIDVLIAAAARPGSPRFVIDRDELAAMQEEAILVDVSRGGVVRESALATALQKKQIAGAALDVFETEPLPAESPLWTMPNVIVTPHVASASPKYWERAVRVIATNLRRIEAGRPMLDEIEPVTPDAAGRKR